MRTTTRSCDGTTKVCCPPAPDMKYASLGRFHWPSPFTQNCPPYSLRRHAGAGVLTNLVHPSGSRRCPFHWPSRRYSNPNRAQFLAVP